MAVSPKYGPSKGSDPEISPHLHPYSFSLDFSLFDTFSLFPGWQFQESKYSFL